MRPPVVEPPPAWLRSEMDNQSKIMSL